MTDQQTHDRILDKLTKIKAHMESAKAIGSQHEAEAFAAVMQRLMDLHQISMTDLEVEAYEQEEPVQTWRIDYAKHGVKLGTRRNLWKEDLAGIIAYAHHCRILVHPQSDRISLVGRKSDCEVAEYMIVTLQRLVHKMALAEWWKEWRKMVNKDGYTNTQARQYLLGFRVAYVRSFSTRLSQRYREERTSMETSTSTALVRLSRADAAVADYMDVHFKKAKTASALTGYRSSHALGYQRGREAADRINLHGTAMTAASSTNANKALK